MKKTNKKGTLASQFYCFLFGAFLIYFVIYTHSLLNPGITAESWKIELEKHLEEIEAYDRDLKLLQEQKRQTENDYAKIEKDRAIKNVMIEELEKKLDNLQSKPNTKQKVYLFIGILSAPNNVERRSSVRDTWVKLISTEEIVYKFFVGKTDSKKWEEKIVKEQEEHSDIIRLDIPEVYEKLIDKTLAVMSWADSNWEFSYFMKTDDDSFIRPELLTKDLHSRSFNNATYMGFIHQRSFVYRFPGSKFYEPDFNDCETHLPYASGCGYILTQDLVNYLSKPPIPLRRLKNEDAGIGFLLSPLRVKRIHEPKFHPEREGKGSQLCPTDFLLQHRL